MKALINYSSADFLFVPFKTIYIENITVHASTERDASMQIWPSYKEMWLIKQYSFNEY